MLSDTPVRVYAPMSTSHPGAKQNRKLCYSLDRLPILLPTPNFQCDDDTLFSTTFTIVWCASVIKEANGLRMHPRIGSGQGCVYSRAVSEWLYHLSILSSLLPFGLLGTHYANLFLLPFSHARLARWTRYIAARWNAMWRLTPLGFRRSICTFS